MPGEFANTLFVEMVSRTHHGNTVLIITMSVEDSEENLKSKTLSASSDQNESSEVSSVHESHLLSPTAYELVNWKSIDSGRVSPLDSKGRARMAVEGKDVDQGKDVPKSSTQKSEPCVGGVDYVIEPASRSNDNPFIKATSSTARSKPPTPETPKEQRLLVSKIYDKLRADFLYLLSPTGDVWGELSVIIYVVQLIVATLAVVIKELLLKENLARKSAVFATELIPENLIDYAFFTQYIPSQNR
ncbi:LAME_0H20362g1_1 [Lachancea meyersii CBS 8951]|uniref:LAME_0H20362g1_1 n=1 Tax=Lachancea meyersii CBS 8951 TaxID=1266667 RepID=A0A1G4KJX8_9SACH|nr:LAME_0H20362g1_1 [Lachancea meyersii CBS 8951]